MHSPKSTTFKSILPIQAGFCLPAQVEKTVWAHSPSHGCLPVDILDALPPGKDQNERIHIQQIDNPILIAIRLGLVTS